jgi:hypothetical protein
MKRVRGRDEIHFELSFKRLIPWPTIYEEGKKWPLSFLLHQTLFLSTRLKGD